MGRSLQWVELTVPRRTYLPEALVTGLAVWAVLGVRIACSMVPGLPDWVPGRAKPLRGRPDWDRGLENTNCADAYNITVPG